MRLVCSRGLGTFAAVLVLPALLSAAAPAYADESEPVDRAVTLANLSYQSGVLVEFTMDELSGEYGLGQQGQIGRNAPVAPTAARGMLITYLEITPRYVPVPELLVAEHPSGTPLPAELAFRTITPGAVTATDLAIPMGAQQVHGCFDTHFDAFDWHDGAFAGMSPKEFASSAFGGKFKYVDSYVANCTTGDDFLWARHRIYYKNGSGHYVKHYERKVPPLTWDAESKGSIRRYRKVLYDDGWNSSPQCGSLTGHPCQYTREGGFSDS